MKLTAQIKLLPTIEQEELLRATLERANDACNTISQVAWDNQTFRQFKLHHLCYHDIRAIFGLSSQATVRCIAKVADAYKKDRRSCRRFKLLGAIAYDDRILSFNQSSSTISIWTINGRQSIPFVCGVRQAVLLKDQKGESDLIYRRGSWYILATCDVSDTKKIKPRGVLGIDLGINNIATDSDGSIHCGKGIKNIRYRHRRLRRKLQQKGTKGSHRRLRKLAGQERRFATWVNHNLSKRIVVKAEGTKRGIALENLTHIRSRVTVSRSQRVTLSSWAFSQLRQFITYKAELVGIPVYLVDPRNTSRTCPICGHCSKENRKTQASFICTSCGFAGHADVIAAGNIACRAEVNPPYCSDAS